MNPKLKLKFQNNYEKKALIMIKTANSLVVFNGLCIIIFI